MKFSKDLSREFKKELLNAVRLSVFLTALVFGFLIFQNRTATQEEIASASYNPETKPKCVMNAKGNRVPASEGMATDAPVSCD